jgi:hypothetical protein
MPLTMRPTGASHLAVKREAEEDWGKLTPTPDLGASMPSSVA